MAEIEEKVVNQKSRNKKLRVIQAAKEFHVSVESLMETLREEGFDVKNQMSPVSSEMYEILSERLGGEEEAKAPSQKERNLESARKEEQHKKEKERLDSVRKKIQQMSEEKPPTLEEVQKKAKEESEKEKKKAEEAEKKRKKKEQAEKKKLEKEKVKKEAEKKAERERKLREEQSRRLDRLLSHPTTEKEEKEVKEKETKAKVKPEPEVEEKPKEVEEPKKVKKEKEEKPAAEVKEEKKPKEEVKEEAKPETEEKKKKKVKKKDRVAEEKKKTKEKAAEKPKKKKKREKRKKVSEEDVEAAIKKTMQAMEDKGKTKRKKQRTTEEEEVEEGQGNVIKVSEYISVAELADAMNVEPNDVIKKCMEMGMLVSINQRLDIETIEMVADEFGFDIEKEELYGMDVIEESDEKAEDPSKLEERPPVITIMGHVDHGKTSLLDHIRKSNIIAGEMGSITQHIGAYSVTVDSKSLTFLDTPGHEAFTAMRARGAQVTDIVVLIVAADDNVMPQTIEAINHAKAANVPIIVAINKIDKPNANPDLVKKELADNGILIEEWGGNYPSVEISAKYGQNIDQLLELLILQAELLELQANPDRLAKGVIVESELDKGRGPIGTVLVQKGSIKVGDPFIAGHVHGKVRAMFDERGNVVDVARPSTPVQIIGFDEIPVTGDSFNSLESDRVAREISAKRQQLKREKDFRKVEHITLDEFSRRIREETVKELRLIIKGDVVGSIEALSDSLVKLTNEEVSVNIIHKGVGAITETDVLLASASDAIILGFHVRPNVKAWSVAEREKVDIRTYSVIYDAINDVKSALEGLLEPIEKEKVMGAAEIREVFQIPKVGNIAGCYVESGKIERDANVRVVRDGIAIYEGKIDSLKRFKEDVREVRQGYECGIGVDNFNDIKVGDSLEAYQIVKIKKSIEQ